MLSGWLSVLLFGRPPPWKMDRHWYQNHAWRGTTTQGIGQSHVDACKKYFFLDKTRFLTFDDILDYSSCGSLHEGLLGQCQAGNVNLDWYPYEAARTSTTVSTTVNNGRRLPKKFFDSRMPVIQFFWPFGTMSVDDLAVVKSPPY